jgi:protein-S-isoprenylcysteine O-methyltransferase Ste14
MALWRHALDPLPSRATVAAVLVMLGAFLAAMHFARPAPWSLAAGLPLMAFGIAVRLATNAVLRKNQETCRDGLYALCRHPMYVGTLSLAGGAALVLNHAVAAALFAAALAISLYRIRREERFLEQSLAGYSAYRRETPAFPTPASVARALRRGARWPQPSLRQCFLNGEMLRLNLYLPLILAAGIYLARSGRLPVPGGALAAGCAACLLLAALSARLHPQESRRSRLGYLLPAALSAALLPLAAP